MARRRRRRPRVVWLPVHGRDDSTLQEGSSYVNGIGGFLAPDPTTGAVHTDFKPVTFDYSDSPAAEEGVNYRSLQDLTSGNGFRLRRIVGKCFISAALEADVGTPDKIPLIDVAAGFILNRTDDSGNPYITASGVTGDLQAGPLAQDGAEDPWIWRRRWLLSPIPSVANWAITSVSDLNSLYAPFDGQGQFPMTTAGYGSVQDGPHIDQKTARVIGRQERLYFWIQARVVNADANTMQVQVPYLVDIRLLGSLRMNVGNRRNASR